jgi:hypothetical protein
MCRVLIQGRISLDGVSEMKRSSFAALAGAMLLSGMTATSAGTMPPTEADSGDYLSLNSTQEEFVWGDLYMPMLNQTAPSGFVAMASAMMPESVTTAPVPPKAASHVPALKSYDFAVLQNQIVIVNPADRVIAKVISQ